MPSTTISRAKMDDLFIELVNINLKFPTLKESEMLPLFVEKFMDIATETLTVILSHYCQSKGPTHSWISLDEKMKKD